MADKPKIDYGRLEEYSRQPNARVTLLVQCQNCRKNLKYTGSKRIITCPSCAALVPTEGHLPLPPPEPAIGWDALSPNATKKELDEPLGKKIEFSQLEIQAMQAVKAIKAAPRFPVVLTAIWSIWFIVSIMVYTVLVNAGEQFGDVSNRKVGNRIYFNYEWQNIVADFTWSFALGTAFLSLVLSALAYFWIAALEKSK